MSFKVVKAQHVLAVDDFEAAVAYFTEMLGFTEYNRVGGWSFLQLQKFWLMVGDCRGEVPIKEPIANKPWGLREFLVETPEGHRIKFGQALL